ncbi:MAG: hypothetical protein WCO66_04025 [Candidatus Absconditabacteria bacterium]
MKILIVYNLKNQWGYYCSIESENTKSETTGIMMITIEKDAWETIKVTMEEKGIVEFKEEIKDNFGPFCKFNVKRVDEFLSLLHKDLK